VVAFPSGQFRQVPHRSQEKKLFVLHATSVNTSVGVHLCGRDIITVALYLKETVSSETFARQIKTQELNKARASIPEFDRASNIEPQFLKV
jgi:hypothetical protein